MFKLKYPTEQAEPPLSPRETLPTMYDLPSEDPEEPGLPDEYHDLQAQLLSLTFLPRNYPSDRIFTGSDLNLYYDVRNQRWYKRPDWFAAVGVPRLYDDRDLRLSYVIWQEGVSPIVVVELLSPGTAKQDLGEDVRSQDEPPTKWEVYEQILRVPYYVVYDRYSDRLRAFVNRGGRYQQLDVSQLPIWMPAIELSLGVWQGNFRGIDRLWLRWYDADGNLIPTEAEAERQRGDRLAQKLRELGIDPDSE